MKRRTFITASLIGTWTAQALVGRYFNNARMVGERDEIHDISATTLARIVNASAMGAWSSLPIGERMINIARFFLDVPYVGGTLEGSPEQCRINLAGLDCVTFFEDTLGIARMIAKGGTTFEDLQHEITFTRYRHGMLNGFESRLHYTADWIADNIAKGVVEDVTPVLGGVPLPIHVSFMSTHPQFYKPLQEHPELIETFAVLEQAVNRIPRFYIPRNNIAAIEDKLRSGDIIAVATSKSGLDYAHTGLINEIDGKAHFMHASSSQKKVVIDKTISEYVNSVPSHTGITIVRPL